MGPWLSEQCPARRIWGQILPFGIDAAVRAARVAAAASSRCPLAGIRATRVAHADATLGSSAVARRFKLSTHPMRSTSS